MIQFGFPTAITFVIFWKENELETRRCPIFLVFPLNAMAKWGEGDPRWIVEERADAKNVNNWHW